MRKLLLALLFSLSASACSNIVSESSLVGDYVAHYGNATAILSLKADHTYTHAIRINGTPVEDNEATWKQMVFSGGTVVIFSGFRAMPAYRELQKVQVGWDAQVDRTWLGRFQFCFDLDVGYCYVKQ
jgi:cytochrome c5